MKRWLNLLFYGLIFALLVSSLPPSISRAEAPPQATVSINAPAEVLLDSDFLATVDITQVQNLAACNYDVSFNPSILALKGVSGGEINGTQIPVSMLNTSEPGKIRIFQNVGYDRAVSGSGYLAEIRFHVIGAPSQTSEINLSNGVLGDNEAQPIQATWLGTSVHVTAHETAILTVNAPAQVYEDGNFTATVDISQVANLDASNYDVLFNPAILQITNITGGQIGGTVIPVDTWNRVEPGRVAVVQNVPGVAAATGSGTLAVLWFQVIGSEGQTSDIDLLNVVLGDNEAQPIPAQWSGDSVQVAVPVTPVLCTIPYPPSHDFGEVPRGETRQWSFQISNCGTGTLEWTVSDDQPWITLTPASGTATTESDAVTVSINTTGLQGGLVHSGTIAANSNGGTATANITVSVVALPIDLTVTELTWAPAQFSDGDTVTFTATLKNIGTGHITDDFYARFDMDGVAIGHRRIVGGLNAGASTPVTQTWQASPGTHSVTAYVDEYGAIAESDETNNALSQALPEIASADLIISAITWSPQTINNGDSVTFIATVQNIGSGGTSREFHVFFEMDGAYIGQQKVFGLGAGNSTQVSQSWTATKGSHTVKATADRFFTVAESNENNNELSQALPQILAADLTVSNLTWAPQEGITDGQEVTLTATVQNTGSADVLGSFFVRFEIDGTSMGRTQVTGGLAVGQSKDVSRPWIAAVGTHTAKAIADDDNAVDETNETNNGLSQALPAIPSSDLKVASIVSSPAANIYDGMTVTLTATVQNISAGGTLRNFVVRFEVDGVHIGTQTVSGGLAAGGSKQVSQTWTAQVGAHTAKAIADKDNAISESNETNNELVQALSQVLAPDLAVTGIAWSPQANISDGAQVTLTATVKNIGTGDTSRDFFVRFEVDGVYIGHQLVTGGLTAGQSKQVNQTWTAQVGTHIAEAIADETNAVTESNEDNNGFSQSLPQILPSDLVITGITWSPQTDINDGAQVTLTATVKNIGSNATSRDFFVYFEIDNVSIGQQKVTGGLAIGESKQVSQTWTAQSGSHTAKAIADGGAHITESNETNNQLTQVLPEVSNPDLGVVSIVWAPASISDGQQLNLTATVKNIGTGATSRNFHVRFEVDGTFIGRQQVTGGLAAAETRQVSQAWTAQVGTHTAKAIVDEYNVVAEAHETNNELSQSLPEVLASDLTVTSIAWSPEANSAEGQQVTLTAAVKNIGAGATSRNFHVRFEIDGNPVGSQQVIGGLGAGETRQVSQAWTALVGTHTVKAIADEHNAVTESNEANNHRSETLPEVIAPDLVVAALNWSSGAAALYEGVTVHFNATIQNTGAGDTRKDFHIRFEVDGNLIGRQPVHNGLAAGDSVEVTWDWTAQPGPHLARAIVDDSNTVAESNEGNNQRAANLPLIPSADLTVSGIVWTPEQINDGDSVTFTATIQNNGDSTLGNFYVRFEIDGQIVGRQLVSGGLAGGASQQVSQTWVATPGSHQVTAIADGTNTITESNENNNALSQAMPGIAYPDLIVAEIAFPANIAASDVITLTATVTNSVGSTSREFWVRFEIDDSSIGRKRVSGLGSSIQVSQTWVATHGSHTLKVIADDSNTVTESNEQNNALSQNLPRVIAPDLVISNIVAPEGTISGQQIEISWTLSNQGEADAAGNWNDQVFLSTDQQPGGDQFMGIFSFSGTIPAGGSVVRSQTISLPLIMSGNRWVIIIADTSNQIRESNENNNVAVDDRLMAVTLSPFPNLQVSSVTAPPTAFSQQTTVVEWTVTNAGTGSTKTAAWYDNVWLSLDEDFDALDTLLGSVPNASALNAGEGYVNSLTVTIPRGTEGNFYFIIKTYAFNHVFEFQGEDDNLGSGGPTSVAVPPQPDLQLTLVNAPASAFSGQAMTLNWKVANKGGARTDDDAWVDVLFMSDNEVLDNNDRELRQVVHRGALDPEQGYEASELVGLPIGVSGTFFFFVVTDAGNDVFEHGGEGNNTGFDQVNINLTPPPDLEVELVDAPGIAKGSSGLTITYRVANNGASITPNYSWEDAFYLSTDTQLDGGDLFLGTRTHTGTLDAGLSYTNSVTFTLPVGLEGSFFALVKTDSGGAVFEAGATSNNIGFDPNPIAVCACPPGPGGRHGRRP